jgi:hypothetical protein
MKQIRLLRAEEVNAKVKSVFGTSVMLLIYKDARVDMAVLDETFGAENWQCSYREVKGNMFCTISVWDKEKSQWVSKEDVGIESNTEGEKGEASDSFKRAGTKWGIGRELYTAPKIWIKLDASEVEGSKVKVNFVVAEIEYIDRAISYLRITDDKGKERYRFGKKMPEANTPTFSKSEAWRVVLSRVGGDEAVAKGLFKQAGADTSKDITEAIFKQVMSNLDAELDNVPFGGK